MGSDLFEFPYSAMRGLSQAGHRIEAGKDVVLKPGEALQFQHGLFTDLRRSSCSEVYYAGVADNGGRIAEHGYNYGDIVAAADRLPSEGEFVLVPNSPHTQAGLERKLIYKPRFGEGIVLKDLIVLNARLAPYSSTQEAVDVRTSFTFGRSATATLSIATTESCLETDVWPIIDDVVSFLRRSKG